MADKIFSVADGLHDELPSITTAKAGRILITTDRGEMYYEPEDKKRIQVNPQADWQQNDETANDYVKNRPGGYEEILENTLSEVAFTGASSILDMTLVVGDTYIVTFDGVEYVSTAKQDDGYPIFIGNTTYAWHSTITDDPFCIYVRAVNSCYINCDSGDHTVKVDKGNIVKIDEKYLDIRNTNIVNGSKTGSLRTIGSAKENSSYTMGDYAFAEGQYTIASGYASHAEGGGGTTASGSRSHAEGIGTKASGYNSHAEGSDTKASGQNSHAEGSNTKASGQNSHAEGGNTTALGNYSHAEGYTTTASGNNSHAEGQSTKAGQMGFKVTACEKLTDTTGTYTLTSVNGLSVNLTYSVYLRTSKENCGKITAIDTTNKKITVNGYPDIALSTGSSSTANYLTIVGKPELGDIKISGDYSHAEGHDTKALGDSSHAEGTGTIASGNYSHAEGFITTALGDSSHAEGNSSNLFSNVVTVTNPTDDDIITAWNSNKFSLAKKGGSHVEGSNNLALGGNSHAEGYTTQALGHNSHTEGWSTTASGDRSHAEGSNTTTGQMGFRVTACQKLTDTTGTYTLTSVTGLEVNQRYSIYLGSSAKENCGKITAIDTTNKKVTVDGYPDIALSTKANYLTIVNRPDLGDISAFGEASHAEGYYTTASSNYQHVQGKYNIADATTYADIIGNGSSDTERSNAATVDWQGNAWYAGDVYVGSTSGTNKDEGSKKLATENRTNNTFTNALKGNKSGSVFLINDVSPVTHDMAVKISSIPKKNLLNKLIAKAYSSDMKLLTEDFMNTYCSKKISFKQGITYTFSIKSVSGFSGSAAWAPEFYIFDNGSLFVSNTESSPPVTFSTDFFTSDSSANEYTCYNGSALWSKGNIIASQGPWSMTITPVKDFEAVFIITDGNVTDSVTVTEAQIEVGSTATSYVPYIENPITDLTAVTVSRYGKNFIDIDSIANDIVEKNPTSCEITDFDGKRCLKIGATSTIRYTIQTLIPLYGLQLKVYSTGYSASFMGYTKKDTGTSVFYINVSAENEWVNITRYYPGVSQYYTGIQFYKTDVTKPIYIDLDSVMLEASHTATEYEPYKGAEYTPTADGTVNGVTSLYPNTTLTTDTEGVIIDCEYNRDINKAFAELQQAIISLGGNV